jgi:hypothetical protein
MRADVFCMGERRRAKQRLAIILHRGPSLWTFFKFVRIIRYELY